MAEVEEQNGIDRCNSPEKDSDSDCTPPPLLKKQRLRRRPSHKATCPMNPSRRLVFSSQEESSHTKAKTATKRKRKTKHRHSGRSKKQKFKGRSIDVSGTWVQCSKRECMKWRYLADITDPSHVPDVWECEMNSDSSYNSCELPEQDYSTLEFVHSKYTEGSLVWAKMQSYPWWPAMVEEDPDSELCLYPDPVTGCASDYHVVFLDKSATRCWVKASNIKMYEGGDCPGPMTCKGNNFTQRIQAAKANADKALELPMEERIRMFSFSASYKGQWGREEPAISDDSQCDSELKKSRGLKPKKKFHVNKEKPVEEALLSHSDMEDILDEAEALLGEVQDIVMEAEDEESLIDELDAEDNVQPSLKTKAGQSGDSGEPKKKKKSKKLDIGQTSQEIKLTKEQKRLQKEERKAERERIKAEMKELKEKERQEMKEKQQKEREIKKVKESEEKKLTKEKEKQDKQEEKERLKQEKKEKEQQEKQEKKEKEKQEKREKKAKEKQEKQEKKEQTKDASATSDDKESSAKQPSEEEHLEKLAKKEKKRQEKAEKKRLKKEMKAKKKEDECKQQQASGNKGEKGKPSAEKGTEKVKPSFQKPKKPTFSAPTMKPSVPLQLEPPQPKESPVSEEIRELVKEAVSGDTLTSEAISLPSTTEAPTSGMPSSKSFTNQVQEKPTKKPKFSIKTKDGQKLSESNVCAPPSVAPNSPTQVDGLGDLEDEVSVDIGKILEANKVQDVNDAPGKADVTKDSQNSNPSAFPLSQMTDKQLEPLSKTPEDGHPASPDKATKITQDDATENIIQDKTEANKDDSHPEKVFKKLNEPEIQEYIPDTMDWSEPDEPQTVPGKKAYAAATTMNDSEEDSDPFEMEE